MPYPISCLISIRSVCWFKSKRLCCKIKLKYIQQNKMYIWKKLEIIADYFLVLFCLFFFCLQSITHTCSAKHFLVWIILTSFKYRFLSALNPLMTTASVLMKAPGPPSDPTLTVFADPAGVERKTSSIAALRLKAKEHSAQIPQLNLVSNTNKELC